jgi:hypothetical protein
MTQTEESEFRRNASLEILCKMLENVNLVVDDYSSYLAKNTAVEPMKIYDFAADVAVKYAEALIKKLEK